MLENFISWLFSCGGNVRAGTAFDVQQASHGAEDATRAYNQSCMKIWRNRSRQVMEFRTLLAANDSSTIVNRSDKRNSPLLGTILRTRLRAERTACVRPLS